MTEKQKENLQSGIVSLSGALKGAGEDRAAFVLSAHLFRIADFLEWVLDQDELFFSETREKQSELITRIVTRS